MSESLVGLSMDLKKAVSKIFPNHTTLVGNDLNLKKHWFGNTRLNFTKGIIYTYRRLEFQVCHMLGHFILR